MGPLNVANFDAVEEGVSWHCIGKDRQERTGTGELRMTHSRVSWMLLPVDKSMAVSAPQMVLHCSFSTSCTHFGRHSAAMSRMHACGES